MKESLKNIRADINKDNIDIKTLEQHVNMLNNRITKLEESVIPMYKKVIEEQKDPETGKCIDPETGEDKTEHYNNVLHEKQKELEELKQELKNCEEKIESIKKNLEKLQNDAKKTAAAQKITDYDKANLRHEEKKIHKDTQSTKTQVSSTTYNVKDSAEKVKSNKESDNIQEKPTNDETKDNNSSTNTVLSEEERLIRDLKKSYKNGEKINFNNPEVKKLLNKPETAKEILKFCPESFEAIPIEILEKNPKEFTEIFKDSVNEKFLDINATQNDPNLANTFINDMKRILNDIEDEADENEGSLPVKKK